MEELLERVTSLEVLVSQLAKWTNFSPGGPPKNTEQTGSNEGSSLNRNRVTGTDSEAESSSGSEPGDGKSEGFVCATTLPPEAEIGDLHRCTACGKGFRQRSELIGHRSRVHKLTVLPCRLCNKKFVEKTELDQHVSRSHDVDYFKCVPCAIRFTDHDGLDNHVRLDHPPDHKCPTCGREFPYQYLLSRHVKMHKRGRPRKPRS
ncbi:zinc finger protein 808-like [Folsomia candida]|uniref:zinc finger protein 808-like n=1 Tax=Folsomia candida TaxID=158441 RepID=UPI001604C4B1|nr:zinc finger protein 808-like [Folsomia candida]